MKTYNYDIVESHSVPKPLLLDVQKQSLHSHFSKWIVASIEGVVFN